MDHVERWRMPGHGVLAVFVFASLLSACATAPNQAATLFPAFATAPTEESVATAQSGYGRAYGRVVFVEEGTEREWSSFVFADTLTVFVRPLQGGDLQYMSIVGKGEFAWPLHPGDYVIVGYQTRRGSDNERKTARLWLTFSVPRAGQAAYIGELRIVTAKGAYRFAVQDDYANALAAREVSFKQANFESVKGLMRTEPQPGNYKRVSGICQGWGIKCEQIYNGVEPVLPEGTAEGFPTTADLTPVLEWKPSAKPGVTYDVAIFESLSFTYGMAGAVARMHGARVAYAEALSEPRFRLRAPLAPGKRYEWTVRLRDGDTVSTWSVTNRFVFLLVAATARTGVAFGFQTPTVEIGK